MISPEDLLQNIFTFRKRLIVQINRYHRNAHLINRDDSRVKVRKKLMAVTGSQRARIFMSFKVVVKMGEKVVVIAPVLQYFSEVFLSIENLFDAEVSLEVRNGQSKHFVKVVVRNQFAVDSFSVDVDLFGQAETDDRKEHHVHCEVK